MVTEGSVAKNSIEECLHLGHLFLWGKYQISASSVMALMDEEFMLCYQLVLGTYKILDEDLTQTMVLIKYWMMTSHKLCYAISYM